MNDWKRLLERQSNELGLDIVDFCASQNANTAPRYFHANVVSPSLPLRTWRLKVVNPFRHDLQALQNCCRYSNLVHARLARTSTLNEIVHVPGYFDVPEGMAGEVAVSEFLQGAQPNVNDLDVITNLLVALLVRQRQILRDLQASLNINRYNQPHYRQRLTDSLRAMDDLPISHHKIISAFDSRFARPAPPEGITFCHGDFSFANLKHHDEILAFLDFEHSHIGVGCVDLAHLHVNLIASGQEARAVSLRDSYQTRATVEHLWWDRDVFEGLLLERAAGKINSMMPRAGDSFKRLWKVLLNA